MIPNPDIHKYVNLLERLPRISDPKARMDAQREMDEVWRGLSRRDRDVANAVISERKIQQATNERFARRASRSGSVD